MLQYRHKPIGRCAYDFFYTNPILIAAAVIPAVFLLVHVYRADKLEKEPAPLLISLVLYGIAATFIALLLERFGSWLLGRYFRRTARRTTYSCISASSHFGGRRKILPPQAPDVELRRFQLPV